MEEIVPGIYYETSYPGVTLGAVIMSRGVILIDAPLRPEDSRAWRSALNNRGAGAERLLVYLDAHPDRTIGGRALEGTNIAHHVAAQIFAERPTTFKGQNADVGAEWEICNDLTTTRWAQPDITFSDHLWLSWGQTEVLLEYHPGPSSGAIWAIIHSAKVVFIGDAVLVNQPPFLEDADIPAWLQGLELLASQYRDYTLISGRGGPITRKDVLVQQKILRHIDQKLEEIHQDNASSEKTHLLVSDLLGKFSFPAGRKALYAQRLRNGLQNYYERCYGRKKSFYRDVIDH